jgi:hypothetical protein
MGQRAQPGIKPLGEAGILPERLARPAETVRAGENPVIKPSVQAGSRSAPIQLSWIASIGLVAIPMCKKFMVKRLYGNET